MEARPAFRQTYPVNRTGYLTRKLEKWRSKLTAELCRGSRSKRAHVQIARAPVGNLYHRGWACMAEPLAAARAKWAPEKDLATVAVCEVQGNPAWERALFPKPPRPMRKRAAVESFRWIVEPDNGIIEGDVYPDGSALDGPAIELMRCGWPFVVLTGGIVTAAACGGPPPWIVDIAGAEAWALLQAAIRAFPGDAPSRGIASRAST